MDEILIEEKRYVSSKRAAKVTGYAKDYIGQLCREGRVPARLVGRSWYVLESAIHDHRFGNPEPKSEGNTVAGKQTPTSGWESPRYESSKADILPTVNRLREAVPTGGGESDAHAPLQDSWRAWFDRVTDSGPPVSVTAREESPEVEMPVETKEVPIPIHTVYELPPEDLLPRHTAASFMENNELAPPIEEAPEVEVREIQVYRGGRGGVRAVQAVGVAVALISAGLAVIGTGYFDKYVLSNSPVGLIAGVALYNR